MSLCAYLKSCKHTLIYIDAMVYLQSGSVMKEVGYKAYKTFVWENLM